MPDFIIRPVVASDWEQWLPLWTTFVGFNSVAASDGVTRTTWARFLDDNEPVHALVAERGGRLLGLAHYIFHRNTLTIAPVCYLQNLFTSEQERGQGIGRKLIEAVCAAAEQAGSPRVYWLTDEANASAMSLYDKLADRTGYVHYRRNLEQ
ncbi:GNAT family N-acetyltransferase [Bosea caraganae]|uniref:GNAT family N-acetyltransferase n=1 Tax=Bosea caraganae TaxID=2763117 RepID=A0A370LCH5_9HYPH|nr:GNAT family N-acetyltransferase [Bosea caraganae]RDJ27544.1 GNAT family N-acetyltransferase [Bosea caraganae]RDJ29559.1 GNAT family N-acetyltransferase [Bosea caraganae]